MRFTLSLAAVACCCLGLMSGRANAAGDKEIRLYAIDCGSLTFKKNGSMVDPCFLLQHPADFFLWDTGLGDALVGHDPPVNEAGVGLHVQKALVGQLAQIGVRPADIKVLAFSHFHVDHTGNANLFTASPATCITWLRIGRERAQTLASMNRVESILMNTAGRLVIQHDPADFASLPKFPAFLN